MTAEKIDEQTDEQTDERPAAETAGETAAPRRPRRRLSAREQLALGSEDPLGSLAVAILIVSFGITTWRALPLGILAVSAALLVLGPSMGFGIRQLRRRETRSATTFVLALVLPLVLAAGLWWFYD